MLLTPRLLLAVALRCCGERQSASVEGRGDADVENAEERGRNRRGMIRRCSRGDRGR